MALMITDVKVLMRQDGASRKIAFLGFATPTQAEHVVSYFHKTYCQSSRLSVEFAWSKKEDGQHRRPWSKHSKGSTKYQKLHADDDDNEEDETKAVSTKELPSVEQTTKQDKRKQEFLAAMGVATEKQKFWANDDGIDVDATMDIKDRHEKKTTTPAADSSDDDSSSDESSVASDDSGGQGADILRTTQQQSTTMAAGSVLTDLDFLKSKAIVKDELDSDDDDDNEKDPAADVEETKKEDDSDSSDDDSDSSDDNDDDDNNVNDKPARGEYDGRNQQQSHDTELDDNEEEDTIAHNRLFIRNLPFASVEEDLQHLLDRFGTVVECHIPVDDQKRTKGFAFCTFSSSDEAARAKDTLDGTDFQGRLLHILPARKSIASTASLDPNDPTLTYKQKQDLLRKQNATGTSQGWSASFVRGDAVVDNLAARLGLNKGAILNVKDDLKSGDAAVRMALGETQIIQENRDYFQAHGIDMEALVSMTSATTGTAKRSTTMILVKNLPFDTEKDELQKLFGDAAQRILLPPSRTIALCEFAVSADAKRAFKKLAYKRFKHVPLYLEWAPLSSKLGSSSAGDSEAPSRTIQPLNEQRAVVGQTKTELSMEVDDTVDSSTSYSIYIKNLNFSTTEDQLRSLFEEHVTVRAVRIPVKVAPVKQGGRVNEEQKLHSMGFGFIECDSDASVRKALKFLQGTVLDGHALELKRSSKSLSKSEAKTGGNELVPKGKNPTKIMCRNVPFQATRKELLQLFGSFGQLKKVRLPKKFNGQHRGFAFMEFLTSREAQSAMKALSRTHLYGRHLVLEWATDKDDMDTLRQKAKRDIQADDAAPIEKPKNKKIRFD